MTVERFEGWPAQRGERCTIPESCQRMMAGMLAESERQMRAYVDDAIGRAADQAAQKAVDEAMRRFNKVIFNTEEPTYEQVTGIHRLQAAGKWAERGWFWFTVAFIGVIAATLVAERLDIWAGVMRNQAGIERPVIGQGPHQ